jgi:hypothetical protein
VDHPLLTPDCSVPHIADQLGRDLVGSTND